MIATVIKVGNELCWKLSGSYHNFSCLPPLDKPKQQRYAFRMKITQTPKVSNWSAENPNPQGKGLRPVLDALNEVKQHCVVQHKHIHQISAELFTSLLILESQIRFKPVFEKPYRLYQKNGQYHLSLIHPQQWSYRQAGDYVGECQLHTDLTWSLALSDVALNSPRLMAHFHQRRTQFDEQLATAVQLQDALPKYVSSFSYYSRVLASGLAHSLGASMQLSGIAKLPYIAALQQEQLSLTSSPNEIVRVLPI